MAEPRDHPLILGAQLRSDMTTLANVSLKVYVNGSLLNTYTSASTPAITQNADITHGYKLQFPANTFNDGDAIEADWRYSATPYAYTVDSIGPAAVDGASFTSTLAAALGALTTRTGTAQTGSSSSITLDSGASGLNDFYVGQWAVIVSGAGAGQSRLITAYNGSTKVATVHSNWKTQPTNTSVFYLLPASDIQGVVLTDTASALTDKTGFALSSAYDPAKTAAQAGDAMALTSGERTTLTAALWNALTSGLTTAGSIGKRIADNLDAAISSIEIDLDADLTSLQNTTDAIKAQTDLLPADPASESTLLAAISAIDVSNVAAAVWTYVRRTLTHNPRSEG